MSPREQPPEPRFFIDRSLGRIAVPRMLRDAGWDVITLAEHYGTPQDQIIPDHEWIQEAAVRGWPILMKDKRIRYRPVEIRAVREFKAICFVATRGVIRARGLRPTSPREPRRHHSRDQARRPADLRRPC